MVLLLYKIGEIRMGLSKFKKMLSDDNPNDEEIPEVQDEAYFFALTYVQNTGVTE